MTGPLEQIKSHMPHVLCGAASIVGVVILFAVFCTAGPAKAAVSACSMSASEKRQTEEKILGLLDSGDPITRQLGVDSALKACDPVVRHFALAHAFASDDQEVRVAALSGVVRSSSTFLIEMSGNDDQVKQLPAYRFTGGAFEVRITRFNSNNGTFFVYSNYSNRNNNNITIGPAAVSGDRISFDVDVSRVLYNATCDGYARLEGRSGARLKGVMRCGGDNVPIQIDILR